MNKKAAPLRCLWRPGIWVLTVLLAQACSVTPDTPERPRKSDIDREILEERDAILAQPYIDPLTDFIKRYENRDSLVSVVEAVRKEREQRCQEVYAIYQDRAANRENLGRLKRNYNYSCPAMVATYIEQWQGQQKQEGDQGGDDGDRCRRAFSSDALTTLGRCGEMAASGDPQAQYYLASSHRKLRQYEESLFWAEKAAEQDHMEAQFILGDLYAAGLGTKENPQKALFWKKQAASQGHLNAQLDVAQSYRLGEGTSPSPRMAKFWYRAAAQKGNVLAQMQLGNLYESGHLGEVDFASAIEWYRKAARQGNSLALYKLGRIHANPDYAHADDVDAYLWFKLAELADYPFAEDALQSVRASIPPERLEKLDGRARDLISSRQF